MSETKGLYGLQYRGMTLRDWFAGQALSGYLSILADPEIVSVDPDKAAKDCYGYADAMLAERIKEAK